MDIADTLNSPAMATLVRFGMNDLPAAKEEVKSISKFFRGASFIEDEATVANFLKQCGQGRVLHMSMHAMTEVDQPNLSRLVFSSDEYDNPVSRYYFAGEIAAQSIPAELVVLSACNTGKGEFHRGDGVMSLARAFEYAGAQSTLYSLWRIPDNATRELMEHFYKALVDGKSRADALRQAKLAYLNVHEGTTLAHPFYWAGFVLNGDSHQIAFSKGLQLNTITILSFIGLFMLVVLFYRFVTKRNQSKL